MRQLIRRFIQSVTSKLSERQVIGLLTAACESSDTWTRAALRVPHLASSLTVSRLSDDDARETLRRAAAKFPGVKVCALTDCRRFRTLEAFWINNADELRSIDGPKVLVLLIEDDTALPAILRTVDQIPDCDYFTPRRILPPARFFHRSRAAKSACVRALATTAERSHFDPAHFETIMQAIELTRNIPGHYVEVGVYKGGSAYAALAFMEAAGIVRSSWFFDTFEGFVYDAALSSKDATFRNTHADTSRDTVRAALAEFPAARVEKCEIIGQDLPNEIDRIACANVDVDMYEASLVAMRKIAARLSPGGIIVLDDQGHTPHTAGAYRAAVEFVSSNAGLRFMPIHMASGQMLLVNPAENG